MLPSTAYWFRLPVLIAKAVEPPAEAQQPHKASIDEIVWYPNLIFRLSVEFETALSAWLVDKNDDLCLVFGQKKMNQIFEDPAFDS